MHLLGIGFGLQWVLPENKQTLEDSVIHRLMHE